MNHTESLRILRKEHAFTQDQLSNILGIAQTVYSRYERGANELPIRHLLKLCSLYHVSSDYILGLSDIRKESGSN